MPRRAGVRVPPGAHGPPCPHLDGLPRPAGPRQGMDAAVPLGLLGVFLQSLLQRVHGQAVGRGGQLCPHVRATGLHRLVDGGQCIRGR